MNSTVDMSFVEWLSHLVASHVIDQFAVFMGAGILGLVAHFVKKRYIEKELTCSLYEYAVVQYPDKTLLTVGTLLATCLTYLATGIVASTTWPALIGMAFTTGFSINSSLNKGK